MTPSLAKKTKPPSYGGNNDNKGQCGRHLYRHNNFIKENKRKVLNLAGVCMHVEKQVFITSDEQGMNRRPGLRRYTTHTSWDYSTASRA